MHAEFRVPFGIFGFRLLGSTVPLPGFEEEVTAKTRHQTQCRTRIVLVVTLFIPIGNLLTKSP